MNSTYLSPALTDHGFVGVVTRGIGSNTFEGSLHNVANKNSEAAGGVTASETDPTTGTTKSE
jgi:hypothetical protein